MYISYDRKKNQTTHLCGHRQKFVGHTSVLRQKGAKDWQRGGAGIGGELHVGSDITAFSTSDKKLKEQIAPIQDATSKISKISGVNFVWKEHEDISKTPGKKDVGVIAQEVEDVLPEAVHTRENGIKAVDYNKLVPLLIETVKELTARVEHLESKK